MVISRVLVFLTILALCSMADALAEEPAYFKVEVVDDATGRGVPLVELETIHHVNFVTDSQGVVAISDPDLIGENAWVTVKSHGYAFPKDGFGMQGKSLQMDPGGKATLNIKRLNLAERLYRVTGSGIYRDSALLGEPIPIKKQLLNAGVIGCDSVMAAVYREQIHWFWGDTSRLHYPLGANFHVSGATSALPQAGGLAPEQGVDIDYFTGGNGSVAPMAQMPGDGPTWISALTVLKDGNGDDQMYAGYVKIRNQLESYRWGFVRWNVDTKRFELVISFDEKPAIFLEPQTHSFLRNENGIEYVYFTNPLPFTRVKADAAAFVDPNQYEGFSCLKEGTQPRDQQVDRNKNGQIQYGWKRNTPALTIHDHDMLVKAGVLKPEETLTRLTDIQSGRSVQAHSGSVYWNEFRKRWILITVEANGTSSYLGEVWYAEADEPTGPWGFARKIVTHDQYSFYNPKQHSFFDQNGGKVIYFEGTYTNLFSGNPRQTPRYDYNQIMYRLDLSQSELNLPVAFYQIEAVHSAPFAMRQSGRNPAFYALHQPGPDAVPISWDGHRLHVFKSPATLFYAIPSRSESHSKVTTPLYEFAHIESDARHYSLDADWSEPGFQRTPTPVCRVWTLQKCRDEAVRQKP